LKVIVFTHKSGGLAVEIPAQKFWTEVEETAARLGVTMSPEQIAVACMGKALARHAKDGAGAPLLCEDTDLPADRTFRNAWERDGAAPVKINMDKARKIATSAIRTERAPLLTELDKAFTRAQGQKDDKMADAVEAKRQALRDAPADKRIAEAGDPESLKAAMKAVVAEMKA
jgi:hypothetical protein